MRDILVTGGNGFIGQYVVEELADRGYFPHVLDTRYRIPRAGKVVLGDIRDAVSTTEAIAHVDGVIHLAGVLGTQETIKNPRPAAETNILGGLNVFDACTQYGLPLVNIAVGNYWMNNTYSITKNTMERFAAMYNAERESRITVVRGLNAYGPRQMAAAPHGPSKVRKIMPSFINRALDGDPIQIYGSGEQIMDMIYVTDLAKVLVTALERTDRIGPLPTIDAGTGVRTTVNQIAGTVLAEVAAQQGVWGDVEHLPMRPGEESTSIVLANTDTLEVVGMNPDNFVQLGLGVARTVEYFLDQRGR